jgi:hypothetical protein
LEQSIKRANIFKRGQSYQHFKSSFSANFLAPKSIKPTSTEKSSIQLLVSYKKATHKVLVKLTHVCPYVMSVARSTLMKVEELKSKQVIHDFQIKKW